MRKILALVAAAVGAIGLASSAHAAIVDLTFEGVAASYPFSRTKINDFYNGGTSGAGTSGPDYGVTFSRGLNAACLNSLSVSSCDRVSKGGLGPADSQESALEFNSPISAFMDVAGGFTTDLQLNYVTTLLKVSISLWSGLDGTGDLLATLSLPANAVGCPDYDADFCPFTSAHVSFSGIARSVQFSGIAADFDDITFTAAPEPSTWAMMLIGFAGLGYAEIRRRGGRRSAPA
jgi:opacity protein-like surface antigen